MNLHQRKMIAPIVITILVIFYYIVYFAFLIALLNTFWKYILGIIPFVLSVLIIVVCRERIKEIKGGEEDDLSKY